MICPQLKNPTFVLVSLAGSCDALVVAGLATFGAKLFQEMFHMSIMRAGTIMGETSRIEHGIIIGLS